MLNQRQSLAAAILTVVTLWILIHAFRTSHPPQAIPSNDRQARDATFRQRLVAVGDLHGDIDAARSILRRMKLIDTSSQWIGGSDILVQTGDIVDRGTYALDIYKLMRDLRGQASRAGGKVVSVLGNHEVMNAIGDWRYVSQADIKHFGSSAKRQEIMSINGWLGQEWIANYSVTAAVPLAPYSFSPVLSFTHGSLRPSYPNLTPYPDKINALGRSLLSRALTPPLALPHPPHPYSGLPSGSSREEAELYDGGGPLWWRGLAEVQDEATVCGWAAELRQKTGVRRVIGGHTPDFEKIVHRCNGTIIIIDTGISSAYGGVHSALEIIYTITPSNPQPKTPDHHQDPFTVATASSSASNHIEREEVYAVYPDKRDLIALEERDVKL